MLRHLHIQNFAIIDDINIDLRSGLNVITGETGAGKSIMAEALSLVLGDRADTSVLLHKDKKCIVEAIFSIENKKTIDAFLAENELDAGQELFLRREINASGKSRAFVNDTPVNLDQLRGLSAELVDLHQQFDTLSLGASDFQMGVLDALAGHGSLLKEFKTKYQLLNTVRRELLSLKMQQSQADKEMDYNRFLLSELEEAGLRENEIEEADAELKLLGHSEAIKAVLEKIEYEMQQSDQPVVSQLKSFHNRLQAYAGYHAQFPELLKRLQSVQIEVQDIADELAALQHQVQHDPGKIEQLNDRMATGYKLLKKHHVQTTAELLELQSGLEKKLENVLNIAEAISSLEKQVEIQTQECRQLAATISKERNAEIPAFEEKVNGLLKKVGMPNARLKVALTEGEMDANGINSVEFLFDANKSNRFEPLRKVASGGELSRLMLCIKSLVARSMDMPTLLFDEIDSGISGEAARQVGIILKDLAKQRQLICITHQPQIAGKGDAHYFVYKESRNNKLFTNIRLLHGDERILAIAKMLGGEKPTAAALENAKEMVTH